MIIPKGYGYLLETSLPLLLFGNLVREAKHPQYTLERELVWHRIYRSMCTCSIHGHQPGYKFGHIFKSFQDTQLQSTNPAQCGV